MKLTNMLGYPLLIIFLLLNLHVVYSTVIWSIKHYLVLKWLGVGILAYFIVRIPLQKNITWLESEAHEKTHTIVAMMFGHKIHSSYSGENSGIMYHSGRFGGIFIALAPYCLPILTYLFMVLRLLGSQGYLFVFDILIGITAAFHAVCFKTQISSRQTDIQKYGLLLSYLFITAFLLFNACVIVLSVKMGVINAFELLITQYWENIIMVWKATLNQ